MSLIGAFSEDGHYGTDEHLKDNGVLWIGDGAWTKYFEPPLTEELAEFEKQAREAQNMRDAHTIPHTTGPLESSAVDPMKIGTANLDLSLEINDEPVNAEMVPRNLLEFVDELNRHLKQDEQIMQARANDLSREHIEEADHTLLLTEALDEIARREAEAEASFEPVDENANKLSAVIQKDYAELHDPSLTVNQWMNDVNNDDLVEGTIATVESNGLYKIVKKDGNETTLDPEAATAEGLKELQELSAKAQQSASKKATSKGSSI